MHGFNNISQIVLLRKRKTFNVRFLDLYIFQIRKNWLITAEINTFFFFESNFTDII